MWMVIHFAGLFSLFPSNESTIREILKCSHLAKEGIDAVLMVFSLRSRLTEEEKSVPFVLKTLFGDSIFDYLIVVFTNEDSLIDDNVTINEYLEGSPDFKVTMFSSYLSVETSSKAKRSLVTYIYQLICLYGSRKFSLHATTAWFCLRIGSEQVSARKLSKFRSF